VFHLAALLSTRAEFTPVTAHQVNVQGTLNLLEFAQKEGESHGRPVVFMYPSSIAAYGMPSLEAKDRAGRVKEDDYAHPTTRYGCNKRTASNSATITAATTAGRRDAERHVDFRCVRFPGSSRHTVPSGGTRLCSEMIHAAGWGEAYGVLCGRCPSCSAMPDGVDALMQLATAAGDRLTRTAHNGSFNPPPRRSRRRSEGVPRRGHHVQRRHRDRDVDTCLRRDDSAARHDWCHAMISERAFSDT
jgi:hypothetical protein